MRGGLCDEGSALSMYGRCVAKGRECEFHGKCKVPYLSTSRLLSLVSLVEGGRELLGDAPEEPNERYHHVFAQ